MLPYFRDVFADSEKSCLNHPCVLLILVLGFELELKLDQLLVTSAREYTDECRYGLAQAHVINE